MTDETDEIERTSAEKNSWYKLMQESIRLDDEEYPQGYHWLIAFHQLSIVTNLTKTLENLPEKHPLKSQPLPSDSIKVKLKPVTRKLKKLLGTVKKDRLIDFSKLHFENEIDFSNFVFPLNTNFKNTKFSNDAFFNNAIFSKDVFFNNAVFCETADFEDATFQNKDSYCKETAKFRSTVFEKIANFRNATFWGYANFKDAKLKGRAFFQEATFEWHAPRFYYATFNNEMTWAGITLPKFKKAPVDEYKKVGEEFKLDKCDECTKCTKCAKCAERAKCVRHYECSKCKALIEKNRRRRIEENQNSYENTAILLERTKKFHDQHFFFQYEMGCRRELENNHLIFFMFWLYEKLASYGYGIGRAFVAWFLHIVFGAGFIAIIASYQGLEIGQVAFCSISTSFANANPFVFLGFKEGALMECYECLHDLSPLLFGTIRGLQTVLGILFLFLLLTTLRVRFRLK